MGGGQQLPACPVLLGAAQGPGPVGPAAARGSARMMAGKSLGRTQALGPTSGFPTFDLAPGRGRSYVEGSGRGRP